MKTNISTQVTDANKAAILPILESTPGKLDALGTPLSSDARRTPLAVGERSLTEDLAHLINGEARSSEMI